VQYTPAVIRAIEARFPPPARQHGHAHRMRPLVARVPADRWPDFKALAAAKALALSPPPP
jgi:hypothetical protein